jgi:hypothetical protein
LARVSAQKGQLQTKIHLPALIRLMSSDFAAWDFAVSTQVFVSRVAASSHIDLKL